MQLRLFLSEKLLNNAFNPPPKKKKTLIPPVLAKKYGERTFAHAAPIMWNNLPDSALKTYLFGLSLWYHEPVQCRLLTSFFLQRIETCHAKCYARYKK